MCRQRMLFRYVIKAAEKWQHLHKYSSGNDKMSNQDLIISPDKKKSLNKLSLHVNGIIQKRTSRPTPTVPPSYYIVVGSCLKPTKPKTKPF